MARRGYARQQSGGACIEAWRTAVGDAMAKFTRPGAIKRGVLEVVVANSTLVHELTFQKVDLVRRLTELLPDETIRDLRFRVGAIE